MTSPVALAHQQHLPLHQRLLPLLAVGAARALARLTPARLQPVLELVRRGARPATQQQAQTARDAVVAVSLRCAGQHCLQRSLAAALHCRLHGTWPTWCTGVRVHPFTAHAWIQTDDQPIGEPFPAGHYHPLLTIPPTTTPHEPRR
ncbi:lasso peptide biosynthesis B2 protein [Amycolatopsis anabasis]|uniref:lasso peptide biosynthesis B2 protein n=1 Tax=Amycolatopsis anabasis TaxID=1840409 RepID=UPI00131BD1C7|nr:lasso peptide biosynthesis B2 protein [Amycolatopsis anabasis]